MLGKRNTLEVTNDDIQQASIMQALQKQLAQPTQQAQANQGQNHQLNHVYLLNPVNRSDRNGQMVVPFPNQQKLISHIQSHGQYIGQFNRNPQPSMVQQYQPLNKVVNRQTIGYQAQSLDQPSMVGQSQDSHRAQIMSRLSNLKRLQQNNQLPGQPSLKFQKIDDKLKQYELQKQVHAKLQSRTSQMMASQLNHAQGQFKPSLNQSIAQKNFLLGQLQKTEQEPLSAPDHTKLQLVPRFQYIDQSNIQTYLKSSRNNLPPLSNGQPQQQAVTMYHQLQAQPMDPSIASWKAQYQQRIAQPAINQMSAQPYQIQGVPLVQDSNLFNRINTINQSNHLSQNLRPMIKQEIRIQKKSQEGTVSQQAKDDSGRQFTIQNVIDAVLNRKELNEILAQRRYDRNQLNFQNAMYQKIIDYKRKIVQFKERDLSLDLDFIQNILSDQKEESFSQMQRQARREVLNHLLKLKKKDQNILNLDQLVLKTKPKIMNSHQDGNYNHENHFFRGTNFRGVSKNGRCNWQILTMVDGEKAYLGTVDNIYKAAILYDIVTIQTKGLKSKSNFNYTMREMLALLSLPNLLIIKKSGKKDKQKQKEEEENYATETILLRMKANKTEY